MFDFPSASLPPPPGGQGLFDGDMARLDAHDGMPRFQKRPGEESHATEEVQGTSGRDAGGLTAHVGREGLD